MPHDVIKQGIRAISQTAELEFFREANPTSTPHKLPRYNESDLDGDKAPISHHPNEHHMFSLILIGTLSKRLRDPIYSDHFENSSGFNLSTRVSCEATPSLAEAVTVWSWQFGIDRALHPVVFERSRLRWSPFDPDHQSALKM
jgi:hypothetical protein